MTVNHCFLEFLFPERTGKFQELTDFRKLSDYNKNNSKYILLYEYALIFK